MNLIKSKLSCISIFSGLILSGCISLAPDFSDMSQTYQTVLEKYQNNNLLLNIMRSSKNMPLSFLEIPSVVGTGNINETAGIMAFLYAVTPGIPGANYFNPSVSMSLGKSFNFTQSSLENAEFQKAFISNISIETMTAFTKDHISKELLYTLVIDRFEVTSPTGQRVVAYNNPSASTYNEFQKQLRGLIDGGLTTEIVTKVISIGPTLSSKELANSMLLNYLSSKDKVKATLAEISIDGKKTYQFQEQISTARFCFSTQEYKNIVIEKFGENMLCSGLNLKKSDKEQVIINKELQTKAALLIQLRSPRDIFDYLGQVANKEIQPNPEHVYVRGRKQKANGEFENYGEYPLLVIEKNSKAKPIAIVSYDGETYSIPDQKDTYSNLTFNLLSQFFNLAKVPGSVPPSPAVLVR